MRLDKEDKRLAARRMMEGIDIKLKYGLESSRKLSFSKPFPGYLEVFICYNRHCETG